jgi:hypothetical protein
MENVWVCILEQIFYLSLWELESWCTPKFSEKDYRGQNPLDWRVLYVIGKFLEHRCLKWIRMTHLTCQTQVMAKRMVENQIGNLTPNH